MSSTPQASGEAKVKYAVLIPERPSWDCDRVVSYHETIETANEEAQRLANGWYQTIVVARVINSFSPIEEST